MKESMYSDNESLYISIRNLDNFKLLIDTAEKQLKDLTETMLRIRRYDINVCFEVKKET